MSPRSVESLAQLLLQRQGRVERKLRQLENKADLGLSSIEDGRALDEYNTAGQIQASFGGQFDGTHAAVSLNGPKPPMPSLPEVVGEFLQIKVHWKGSFTNADGMEDITVVAPMDFLRVEVHASQDPVFTAEFSDTIVGTIETPRGTDVTFSAASGPWYVRLVTRTLSGGRSDPSLPVEVTRSEVAAVNETGQYTGATLDVTEEIIYRGDPLSSIIYDRARGMVAWGQVAVDVNMATSTEIGLCELGWPATDSPERMYEFHISPFLVSCSAAGTVGIRLRYTVDGTTPTVNSAIIGYNYVRVASSGFATLHMNRIIGSNNGNHLRVLVCMYASGPTATVYEGSGQTHLYMHAKDLGATLPNLGVRNSGGGTVAAVKSQYTKTYSHNGVRSYLGNGQWYNYNTSKGYQGLQPYTSNGNLKSIWTFPSITAELSGATVDKIEAYFYFEHWYYNAGGTARIRVHSNSSVPSTYSGIGNGMNSGSWPIGAGRWVTVPSSLWAGFQSGTWKGFALDGDGTYNTYGIANSCKLRITYTK